MEALGKHKRESENKEEDKLYLTGQEVNHKDTLPEITTRKGKSAIYIPSIKHEASALALQQH